MLLWNLLDRREDTHFIQSVCLFLGLELSDFDLYQDCYYLTRAYLFKSIFLVVTFTSDLKYLTVRSIAYKKTNKIMNGFTNFLVDMEIFD